MSIEIVPKSNELNGGREAKIRSQPSVDLRIFTSNDQVGYQAEFMNVACSGHLPK